MNTSKRYQQSALKSSDSYKLGHPDMFPSGITKAVANFTARSESHFNIPEEYKDGKFTWFGYGIFLREFRDLWQETFFDLPKEQVLSEFSEFTAAFTGPNGFTIRRLEELHDLGYLPLEIKALPEGSRVNIGVPTLTITNTHPDFFWLPNSSETWLSAELWKSTTSASISYVYRKIIEKYAALTGGNKDFIAWQGHDFSVRGMSGIVDAAKSGAGHLLSFMGTDNLPAVDLINQVYQGKKTFIGGSVPATEHSVMCAGSKDGEVETFRRLIKQYPSGVLSIVSDTWDFWNVITVTAKELQGDIESRIPDSLGLAKIVFRPDSGDPVKIICGDPEAPEDHPAYIGAVQALWNIFGGTTNAEGFKTLNQRVGLIYGDSITPQRAEEILKRLARAGFASDNIVFGIGSFTFQYQTRDTLGFAMKATFIVKDGVGTAIFKDPVTDSGTKKSARGLLRVEKEGNDFVLYQNQTEEEAEGGELRTVFYNGKIVCEESFATIRERVANG